MASLGRSNPTCSPSLLLAVTDRTLKDAPHHAICSLAFEYFQRNVCDILPPTQLALPGNPIRYGDVPRCHVVEIDVNRHLLYAIFYFVTVCYLVALLGEQVSPSVKRVWDFRRPLVATTI